MIWMQSLLLWGLLSQFPHPLYLCHSSMIDAVIHSAWALFTSLPMQWFMVLGLLSQVSPCNDLWCLGFYHKSPHAVIHSAWAFITSLGFYHKQVSPSTAGVHSSMADWCSDSWCLGFYHKPPHAVIYGAWAFITSPPIHFWLPQVHFFCTTAGSTSLARLKC